MLRHCFIKIYYYGKSIGKPIFVIIQFMMFKTKISQIEHHIINYLYFIKGFSNKKHNNTLPNMI